MQKAFKKQKEILSKLGIEKLNEMQEQATLAISSTLILYCFPQQEQEKLWHFYCQLLKV